MQGRAGVFLIPVADFSGPFITVTVADPPSPSSPSPSASQPAFLKINRSAAAFGFCLWNSQALLVSCPVHLSPGQICTPHPLRGFSFLPHPHIYSVIPFISPFRSGDKSPNHSLLALLQNTFAINLFCIALLSWCLSFPLIRSGVVWK